MSVEIFKDFISLDEIKIIKDHYAQTEFQNQGMHPDTNQLQWENASLDDHILSTILHDKIVRAVGSNYKISSGCGKFQRCHVPFGMHTDSKKRINPDRPTETCKSEGRALLIPLDQGPHLNTVFWQEKFFDETSQRQAFMAFTELADADIRNSNLGATYDLAFAWDDPNPARKLYNHLTFDSVFNWELTSAAVWDRNQIHAASDFTKHHAFKDAITIFFE
jgi:hypothetical protein